MPRFSLITTNFTGGELSPELALGRVDIAKYNNGVKRLENCVLTVQGGAKRRPGTRYIAPTKFSTKKARLVDFIYNRGQAYMIEMGEGYMRFMRFRAPILSGGVPVEVATPYGEFDLPAVNYVQKADTAFWVHENAYPRIMQRFSDTQWGMSPVGFITPPFEEQGHYPAAVLTLAGNTPGTNVAATTSAPAFYESDVGRHILYGGGDAFIIGFTSTTQVTVELRSPFPSPGAPSGGWNLTGSPQASIAASALGTIGQTIALTVQANVLEAAKTVAGSFKPTLDRLNLNVVGHGYAVNEKILLSASVATTTTVGTRDGTYPVLKVVDADNFEIADSQAGAVNAMFQSITSGKVQRLSTGGVRVFRPGDVGSYVEINGGLVVITGYDNEQAVRGQVIRPLTSLVSVGANGWILESLVWNENNGYPRAVTINKQRLMFGGSRGYPQTVWASEIAAYLNFAFGTNDDEAFRFELDGPRNSPIRHLTPARQLLVLTESDEMSLKGGNEKPITPTNIQKTDESTVGASAVRPVKVGNEMLFVQAAGKKICAISYRFDIDGFATPDRTVFSSQMGFSGFTQLAHQKEPDSILYAVRNDGQLAVCAYDVEQEVTGWGRWLTQGLFESVATIPTDTGEDAYAIVNRTVGGVTQRYIEVFDPEMLVDCGISGYNEGGLDTWSGLDHLEGKAVQAWGDGSYLGEYIVQGGSVTLTRPAKSVQIGLGFNCVVEMLQPEVGGNGSTAQGAQVHVNEVILRVLDTVAVLVNGQPIEFRKFGDELLDRPPPSFSGDVRRTVLSDKIFQTEVIITQPYPQPFHLLDVIRRVTINDGG